MQLLLIFEAHYQLARKMCREYTNAKRKEYGFRQKREDEPFDQEWWDKYGTEWEVRAALQLVK